MNKKNLFSTLTFFVAFILIFHPFSILADSTMLVNKDIRSFSQNALDKDENPQSVGHVDLTLSSLEVWWADIDNGTLYVRYSVENIGETYHDDNQPILLNISLANNSNESAFAYIEQSSFLDPNTWYVGEKLSGCVQISLHKKPTKIYACVNEQLQIPERLLENNQRSTVVYHGIVINGVVKKEVNQSTIPLSSATIIRCNETSLQSRLRIRFRTNETGHYKISLYPKKPLNESHSYHLLITDKKTEQTLFYETSPLNYNDSFTQNFTFQGLPPNHPLKPLTFPMTLSGVSSFILTSTFDNDNDKIWYKIKWTYGSYSEWIGPYQSFFPLLLRHTWNESGIHQLKVIARDDTGLISSWSEIKIVVTLSNIF